jgi:triacylglycerol lipase
MLAWLALCATSGLAADNKPTVLRDVVYCQTGNESLKCDVYIPAGEGPFPGVLVVHGGAWTIGNKSHMGFASKLLAEAGYTAVAINYRLAPRHKFPAQLEDCQSAVRWLRSQASEYKLDPARVAGFGYSAGGQLVALLGTKSACQAQERERDQSTCLQAVVAGGAPCDFRSIPAEADVLAFWLGGTRKDVPEVYNLASPAHFVSAKAPPTFFYHGEDDELVALDDPTRMCKLLQKEGVAAELMVLPNQGHLRTMFDVSAVRAAIGFLDRHVKKPAL